MSERCISTSGGYSSRPCAKSATSPGKSGRRFKVGGCPFPLSNSPPPSSPPPPPPCVLSLPPRAVLSFPPRPCPGGPSHRSPSSAERLQAVGHHPHAEVLRIGAIGHGEGRLGPIDLVLTRDPRTWLAASAKRSRPEAPMGLDESTPPEQLTGNEPAISVSPASVIFQPSPSSAMRCASSHMGSCQENGT